MVISGYNTRAVIAFCRWATAYRINFHIIASGPADPIFFTKYRNQVVVTRNSLVLTRADLRSWTDALCDLHNYQRVLVLPSTEFLNRFLLEHSVPSNGERWLVPLVYGSLYASISDKHSFCNHCKSFGIDVPYEFPEMPSEVPFVAKPRHYVPGTGKRLLPQLVCSRQDLERFRRNESAEDYFFQEFVAGRSLYLFACISRSGEDVLYSQENLIQQSSGGSIILAKHSDFHKTQEAKRYIRMLHQLDFTGLIMIEVRLSEFSGRATMIEANPRPWGPIQFPIDNGIDLFGTYLRDYDFTPAQSENIQTVTEYYFWSGGLTQESQPVSYHNYSSRAFLRDFNALKANDIYFRDDTFNLYLHEAGMINLRDS